MPRRTSRVQTKATKTTKPTKKSTAAPLPSAALDGSELATVGARFSLDKLLALSDRVTGKVRKQKAFAAYGFGDAWLASMKAVRGEIDVARTSVRGARDAVLPTSKTLVEAIAAAKDWRRRAATVVALTPGVSHRFVATGSSTKKLAASIEDLVPRVAVKATIAHGGGVALSNEGKSVLAQLQAASSAHDTTVGEVSPELRALYVQKGILYEELQRVARAARLIAPAEAMLYAPSSHLRTAMKSRKKKKSAPAATGTKAAATG